jgi:hypothetical protein
MYQKPNVEKVEQAAWERPRYVISRNENDTTLFWIIEMRVPVVFSPSARRKKATRYMNVWGRCRTSRRAKETCFHPIVA